ncbi:M85 family metallopeptidase, partial [Paraburkholderia sp. 2C]
MNTTHSASRPWLTISGYNDALPNSGVPPDGRTHGSQGGGTVQQAKRVKRDNTGGRPESSSDEFADYVVNLGNKTPLTDDQLRSSRRGILQSVESSHTWLADRQTTDAIGNTLLGVLDRSPTFRNLVSYSLNRDGEMIEDISYRNRYTRDPRYEGQRKKISETSLADLQVLHATDPLPITAVPLTEAGYSGPQEPYVSIGAAPNADSPAYPQWQEELIHEVVHHLTGAADPPENMRTTHLGPTEILAQRIGREMGWTQPQYNAYLEDARVARAYATNRTALLDAAQRNAGHERAFFERLEGVSGGRGASADFHELDPPGAAGGAAHNASVVPTSMQLAELRQLLFHDGEVSFFPFADSAPLGKPEGYQSAYAASSADWDTQGRFFQYGEPVGGNPHVRQFDFTDGSKAVITAHQPVLASSDLTGFEKAMTVGGATAAGAVIGFVGSGANPAGAYLGGTAGAAAG